MYKKYIFVRIKKLYKFFVIDLEYEYDIFISVRYLFFLVFFIEKNGNKVYVFGL